MKARTSLALVFAAVLAAAGIGGIALAGCQVVAPAQATKKVTLFTGTTPQFATLYVAEKKGFWKEVGLDVEVTLFTTGAAASEAFRAGQGNIIGAGDMPSARMWGGGDALGLAPLAWTDEDLHVVGKENINRPSDLKGKKVASRAGSTTDFFLQKYLASENVDPKTVNIINLDPAEMVIALDKGDIDAYVMWPPFVWQSLEKTKGVKVIAIQKGYFTEWNALSTTAAYAKNNKDELKAFVAGLLKASKYTTENLDDAAGLVSERLKLDRAQAKRQMAYMVWEIGYTPKFRKDMDDLSAFMIGIKALNNKIDWNTAFDSSFLRAVSADLAK